MDFSAASSVHLHTYTVKRGVLTHSFSTNLQKLSVFVLENMEDK